MDLMVNPVITGFRQDTDGTIKELKLGEEKQDAYANIISQAEGDLEDNKAATINVSTYTQPVEVTPTQGKDGMKKATITLSNIPSPGTSFTFYYWENEVPQNQGVYTLSATPSIGDNAYVENEGGTNPDIYSTPSTVTAVGEGTITIGMGTYTRDTTGDLPVSKS